ncbi:GNAT family N-acetyltransferase [Paenarthrobacter sp. NPDC092416]|uniref:GNAT family N-acetyltransferase n=1 Tax=Paenarthrobacter sp. NPDC092416 TaxID=3364386 RepID=UPI003801CC3B
MAKADADDALTTHAATWTAVESLFGDRGEPSRCWCRWFALSAKEWKSTSQDERKKLFKATFDDEPAPGVLAFREGVPVGWCAVEPKANYPRLERSRLAGSAGMSSPDDEQLWSVTCFVVAPAHRRTGVAAALLDAAVDHALGNGADMIEAYPVDTELRPKAGASELFHGTVSLFTNAGFSVVSRAIPGRALVRYNREGHAATAASG